MFYSAPPLRRCVAIATPRLRSPALRTAIRDTNIMSIRAADSHRHSRHKYYVDSSGVSARE